MLSRSVLRNRIPSLLTRTFCSEKEPIEYKSDEHRRQHQARLALATQGPASIPPELAEVPLFELGYNYNLEENPEYASKVEWAKKQREIIQDVKDKPFKNRNARVVYDKPKYDTDISAYDCWQEYGDMMLTKEFPHELPVACTINVAPKTMVHVFGDSILNCRNENYSTKEWDFVDSNLDRFLVYDYKSSTAFFGENKDDAYYEFNPKRKAKFRREKHISPEEFWASEEPHEFRVNCDTHAEWPKFKKWIETEIEKRKDGPSYEQQVIEKFGEFDDLDQYDRQTKPETTSAILTVNRKELNKDKKKWKPKSVQDHGFVPKKRLAEKYRISN